MLWGIICDVILRHNNNNKCQHHCIVQKISSSSADLSLSQSWQSTILELQNIFQVRSCKKYKVARHVTAKQSSEGQTYKLFKLNIFLGKIPPVTIWYWVWTELWTGPVTKRVLARWRYWCSIKYKVGLSCIYITTNQYILSPSPLSKQTTNPKQN